MPQPKLTRDMDYFLQRSTLDQFSGCWNWNQYVRKDGYGQTHLWRNGRNLVKAAYVAAYECLVGPIPDGKQLDHLCRNKRCINPEHLEPVSSHENTKRGRGYFNTGDGYCGHGHKLDAVNLYRHPVTWKKTCRPCNNAAQARCSARRRA